MESSTWNAALLASLKHIPAGQESHPQVLSGAGGPGLGFALVRAPFPLPDQLEAFPEESWDWVNNVMMKTYPLGVIKDTTGIRRKEMTDKSL